MRDFSNLLGVRCEFCHVGRAGQPIEECDFASDEKRTKSVARQMMRLLQEVNHRIDTLPGRGGAGFQATCGTCHRGVSRPIPLPTLIAEVAQEGGLDSAVRAYRTLREEHYGRDAYNFEEASLNNAALQLGQSGRFPEAFGLLVLNEEHFPQSPGMYIFRGVISLMQADTTAAAAAFREALRRAPGNPEALMRLQAIGRDPGND